MHCCLNLGIDVLGVNSLQRITFSISEKHPSLEAHFPGDPVVPAVVLLDELLEHLISENPEFQVQGFKQVKFLKPIRPAEKIQVQLALTQAGIGFKAFRNAELVFSGELNRR